jgi:general secretion pathway protein L
MRILGIDVGSASIKAVEVDSVLGRYEVHDHHEIKLPPGADAAQELARLLGSLPKPPDRVAVAMRSGQVTFRTLQLPTRDRKSIQAGVGFELEDELPFPSDETVYDYSVLSQSKQGTQVHVAATLRKHVAASLERLRTASVDPDLVTTEAWAYRTLLNKVLSPQAQEHPVLLAQIGHERTVLYVHWKGAPVLARELGWGGRDLTTAICQKYHVPLDQAETAKLDHGFVIPTDQKEQATAEQLEFSETLLQPLQTLLWDLRQVELTTKNVTHEPLSAIYLSGGTALLPGIGRVTEEALGLPVKPLQALSAVATSGVTYSEQTDASFLLASALTLCMVGPERGAAVNLRRGEYAKVGSTREISFATLKRPLLAAASIFICMTTSLSVQSCVYKSKIADADDQLERAVKSFFGTASSSAVRTYLSNPDGLRSNVKKELDKQREIGKLVGANPHSPTELLKELSAAVPKDVVVDMIQYQAGAAPTAPYSPGDETTASMTFLISNPQTAAKLNAALAPKLNALQQGKMEETGEGAAKKWKLSFSGKPAEEAYGRK